MRQPGSALLLLLTFLCVNAGFSRPDWLTSAISSAALLKISPKSDVCILVDRHEIQFKDQEHVRVKVQSAYKIIRPGAGERQAIFMERTSPQQKIEDLHGWLIHPNGDVEDLKKDQIVRVASQGAAGYYDDSQVMIAGFQTLKKDDIVAYEYEIVERGWEAMYHEFVLQIQQPVEFVEVEIHTPEGWELHTSTWRMDSIHYEHPDPRTYRWTGRHLPYVAEEPLMPPWYSLERSLSVVAQPSESQKPENDFSSWDAVSRWVAGVLYPEKSGPDQLSADTTISGLARTLTASDSMLNGKIRSLAHYVRDAVRYVALEIGKGRLRARPPQTTAFNKYGDCKDKSILLCALLRATGVRAFPAITTGSKYVPADLPSPFHFNHCIVAIAQADLPDSEFKPVASRGWIFFDPTSEECGLGSLPSALLGSKALVVGAADSAFCPLPSMTPQDLHRRYSGNLTLQQNGDYAGSISITDFRALAAERAWDDRPLKQVTESLQEQFVRLLPNAKIAGVVRGHAGDSAWTRFEVSGKGYWTSAGNFRLFKLDPFHEPASSELKDGPRTHPVWFGPPRLIDTDIRWTFGWDASPEVEYGNIQDSCVSFQFSAQIRNTGPRILSVSSHQQFDGHLAPVEKYSESRRAWGSRCQSLNQTAIIH